LIYPSRLAVRLYFAYFTANEPYEPPDSVAWVDDTLKTAGRGLMVHQYPDIGHWFAEPDRPDAYNEAAAKLAWEHMLAFLQTSS
jgi:carboxymethylenebutenolidase